MQNKCVLLCDVMWKNGIYPNIIPRQVLKFPRLNIYYIDLSLSFLGENHLTDYYRQTSVIIQCVVVTGLGPTLKLFVLAGFGTGFPRFLDI